MRARLLAGGPGGLADYEVLEMLLFLSVPRRDTKPLAKAVINRFGSLHRSLTAKAADLRGCGLEPASIGVMALVREAARRLACTEAVSRALLSDADSVAAHLDLPARLQRPSHLTALLLNNRNQLLAELPFAQDHSPVDIAQKVARRAVEIHATALILATTRPGQPPAPDDRDCELTGRIAKAGRALSITLHDHMIFAEAGRGSFRRLGLM